MATESEFIRMFITKKQLLIMTLTLIVKSAVGITIYVSPPAGYGTNNPPYTNWADASTNIIEAVKSAVDYDVVLVTNGTYVLTNYFYVTQNIIVKSVNGYTNTICNGNYPTTTNRCLYINNSSAIVDGFTITNGSENAAGGGVYLDKGTVKNCLIVNNRILSLVGTTGAGVYLGNYGTLTNCILKGNSGARYGGGAYIKNGYIYNCQFSENTNDPGTGPAGIDCANNSANGSVNNSTIFNNYGRGMIIQGNVSVNNCKIIGNSHQGVTFGYTGGSPLPLIRNSLIVSNGYIGNAEGVCVWYQATGRVENCTIVSNYIGLNVTGAVYAVAMVLNTIISDSTSGTNWMVGAGALSAAFFTNCCTTPLVPGGTGNIAASPQFRSAAEGNYWLKSASPCINTGTNQAWMTGAVDLDGRPRIRYGTVDMGAYERINEGTICTVH